MSIIHDALKKTHVRFEQSQFSGNPQAPKGAISWNVKILLSVLVVGFLTSAVTFTILFVKASAPSPRDKSLPHFSSVDPTKQKISSLFPPSQTLDPTRSAPPLKLKGIVTMDNSNLALINNQIYREGDFIGRKRVLSISKDRVEIFEKGAGVITLQYTD